MSIEKKTKKDLVREVKFLRLQLKIINDLVKETSTNDYAGQLGSIEYYSTLDNINDNLSFIERYDEKYNFYNDTESIEI